MSLSDFQPINTKKARDSGVSAFMRFLNEESVKVATVNAAISKDGNDKTLFALMDRFGMYLVFYRTKSGSPLACHTVMQYFRQATGWILEPFHQFSDEEEKKLLKKGRFLESYCVTRPTGNMVQATACTKHDLYLLMSHLYSNATGYICLPRCRVARVFVVPVWPRIQLVHAPETKYFRVLAECSVRPLFPREGLRRARPDTVSG